MTPTPALDHPLICQRYFFPRATRPPQPFEVQGADGVVLQCARHEHDPAAHWVVFFHGNGEVVADYSPEWARLLATTLGVNVFFAEYRGYGGSTGTPALTAMLEDVPHLIEAVGAPVDQQVFFGRSIGALYAVEAAHRFPDAAGLILESGVADLLERVLLRVSPEDIGTTHPALQQEVRARFDHHLKLRAFTAPALILHAAQDDLVDPSHAERHHTWLGGQERRLVMLPHGDHNSIFFANAPAYLAALRAFFDEAIRSS